MTYGEGFISFFKGVYGAGQGGLYRSPPPPSSPPTLPQCSETVAVVGP